MTHTAASHQGGSRQFGFPSEQGSCHPSSYIYTVYGPYTSLHSPFQCWLHPQMESLTLMSALISSEVTDNDQNNFSWGRGGLGGGGLFSVHLLLVMASITRCDGISMNNAALWPGVQRYACVFACWHESERAKVLLNDQSRAGIFIKNPAAETAACFARVIQMSLISETILSTRIPMWSHFSAVIIIHRL